MKKNKIILTIFVVMAIGFFACTKNELRMTEFYLPTDKAYTRFALLSPNTSNVMIKINNVKINGAVTNGFLGFYPSAIGTPDYAAVEPGGAFKLSLPNVSTQNDSVVIFTGNLNLEANKFYSAVLSDTGVNRTLWAVSDDELQKASLPDSGFYNLRLINAMVNTPSGLDLIRVDSLNATTVIRDTLARNVAYKSGSALIKTPISNLPSYTFLRYRLVNSATKQPIGGVLTPPQGATVNYRTITMYATGFANGTGSNASGSVGFVFNK